MCGILGYLSPTKNINIADFSSMLYKLKHRGQDSCGISILNNSNLETIKKNNFDNLNDVIYRHYNTSFNSLLGHVRYITSSKDAPIIQPCKSKNNLGFYSFVFNGNIPTHLYKEYNHYTSDTQLILDFFNKNTNNHVIWETLLEEFLNTFRRSYSLIIQTKEGFYVIRDQLGVRPLYYLKKTKNTYIFSSESCVFTKEEINSNELVEVKSGEIISLKNGLMVKTQINPKNKYLSEAHCLFEYIYFLKKESSFENIAVVDYRYSVGEKMGLLDKKYFKNIQEIGESKNKPIVIGIPNTGNDYAISYADSVELPFKEYIVKNKSVGRTFILKNNEERTKISMRKYIFDDRLKGKDVILVDDSLVRGVTMRTLISQLTEFGVGNIHIRIMSPPVISPCNYGIDIPTKEELIYNTYPGEKEMTDYLGCQSIKYFNLEHHKEVVPDYEKKCIDCFSPNPKYDW
jgi:amidophosphoribosyltransferase